MSSFGVPASGHSGAPRYDPEIDPPLLMILNDEVKPSVLFNLEEALGVEVWDRTRLILEIFSLHANVKEARLQVELAKLQYEVPLMREAIHRKRSGERPGFMGGGEYGVADYQDFIKRRMGTIKDDLERIRKERKVRRQVRREGFYLVSLAGYTNAGKSSLLNALTGAGTLSRGTLFSTLGTTTRKVGKIWRNDGGNGQDEGGLAVGGLDERKPGRFGVRSDEPTGGPAGQIGGRTQEQTGSRTGDRAGVRREEQTGGRTGGQTEYVRPILLTDTVGFIQALPSWLLEAFHSTLEEISVSDVVLLVADVSDPVDVMLDKVRVCREELSFLDVTCPVIVVLNKIDLVPERVVEAKARAIREASLGEARNIVGVSSHTKDGLDELMHIVDLRLPTMIPYEASLPMDDAGQRLLSLVHGWGSVSDVQYDDRIVVEGRCDPLEWKHLLKEAARIEGRVKRR